LAFGLLGEQFDGQTGKMLKIKHLFRDFVAPLIALAQRATK
jgi:hypothetical protein